MEKKSNVGLYIIIVILCIALTVAVCFIIFKKDNKVSNQENENQTNVSTSKEDNKNKQQEVSTKEQSTIEKNESTNADINKIQPTKIESFLIELNDKSHDVTFEKVEMIDYEYDLSNKDGTIFYKYDIYYKGNKITSIEDMDKLYQIGDVIMYLVVGSDSTTYAYIIDKNGKELKKFEEFDDGMTMNGIRGWQTNPKVVNDTITFDVSQYCTCCDPNRKKSELALATYQIKYLGNNNFSDLEIISKKTIQEECRNQ